MQSVLVALVIMFFFPTLSQLKVFACLEIYQPLFSWQPIDP
jgi:hypothetical protein